MFNLILNHIGKKNSVEFEFFVDMWPPVIAAALPTGWSPELSSCQEALPKLVACQLGTAVEQSNWAF